MPHLLDLAILDYDQYLVSQTTDQMTLDHHLLLILQAKLLFPLEWQKLWRYLAEVFQACVLELKNQLKTLTMPISQFDKLLADINLTPKAQATWDKIAN